MPNLILKKRPTRVSINLELLQKLDNAVWLERQLERLVIAVEQDTLEGKAFTGVIDYE